MSTKNAKHLEHVDNAHKDDYFTEKSQGAKRDEFFHWSSQRLLQRRELEIIDQKEAPHKGIFFWRNYSDHVFDYSENQANATCGLENKLTKSDFVSKIPNGPFLHLGLLELKRLLLLKI